MLKKNKIHDKTKEMDEIDKIEAYRIITNIFFEYIDKKDRITAMTRAAEQIRKEIKELDYE